MSFPGIRWVHLHLSWCEKLFNIFPFLVGSAVVLNFIQGQTYTISVSLVLVYKVRNITFFDAFRELKQVFLLFQKLHTAWVGFIVNRWSLANYL